MIGPSGAVRVLVATQPIDFRKGMDGLAALVRDRLSSDPFSGVIHVFRSKRADRLKLLYWEEGGFALWYKRLEVGTFRFPAATRADQSSLTISAADLAMLLDGVDLTSVKRSKRYRRVACVTS